MSVGDLRSLTLCVKDRLSIEKRPGRRKGETPPGPYNSRELWAETIGRHWRARRQWHPIALHPRLQPMAPMGRKGLRVVGVTRDVTHEG